MATDLRPRRVCMPVIPSSATVRARLRQIQAEAEKLNVLLRLATELEQVDTAFAVDRQEVARG